MAPLKQKGDWAELEVARDLVNRGFRIAIPYGEDWDFDLLFQRPGYDAIERVQVKFVTPRNGVIAVRCKSHSLTNGRGSADKEVHGHDDRLARGVRPVDRPLLLHPVA